MDDCFQFAFVHVSVGVLVWECWCGNVGVGMSVRECWCGSVGLGMLVWECCGVLGQGLLPEVALAAVCPQERPTDRLL